MEHVQTFPRRPLPLARPLPLPPQPCLSAPTAAYDDARLNYLRLAFALARRIEAGDKAAIGLLRAAAREIAFARER
jgi:hypothetical protein